MESVFGSVHYFMWHYWKQYGDPRAERYFMARYEFYLPFTILLVYFVFCTKLGPALMHHRQAFDLRRVLIVYNSLMVALNLYFFVGTLRNNNYGLDILDFDFPTSITMDTISLQRVYAGHLYLISKYFDLFDTIFFVLRKKQNQVTSLHLYHHTSVPALGWIVFRVIPTNGPLVIFPLVNTLIHVIMYAYYALSALGPHVRPYLWWKKYITLLQIYQFVVYSVFSWMFAFMQHGYPLYLQILAYTQPIIFLTLFSRFYSASYSAKQVKFD